MMHGPAPAQASNGSGDDYRWAGRPPPSPLAAAVRALPESVKLVLASLLVALALHAFFASRKKEAEGPGVRGRVGAVGSGGAGAREGVVGGGADEGAQDVSENDVDVDVDEASSGDGAGGQVLGGEGGDATSKATGKKKKGKVKRNPAAERNYDALICKKEEETSEDEPNAKEDEKQSDNAAAKSKKQQKSEREEEPQSGHVLGRDVSATDGDDAADAEQSSSSEQQQQSAPKPIQLHSQTHHPGLQGYYNWHSTITSLYRIYAIPSYSNGSGGSSANDRQFHQAILPMHPSSERGTVPLYIEVTNRTNHKIDVYWIEYKGREVHRGSMQPRGGVWSQTTWIGHPWTFRTGPGEEGVVLKYAPFRVLSSIAGMDTSRVDQNGNVEGMQKFTIREVPEGFVTRIGGLTPVCLVEDAVLPEPPLLDSLRTSSNSTFTSKEMEHAIQWSCQQMQREDAIFQGNGVASAKRLLQIMRNICLHPAEPKYRKLRLGNRIFQQSVYNTGARGVLLAIGFEEHRGHMECGPGGGRMLPHERIRQMSDAMGVVDRTLRIMEDGEAAELAQPEGGDGFGRAGFGHAGGMNL